ncbi:hypothetical protein MYX82_08715 [Acidobacteria bacterium AH-259-D05]|nr:hypothetical protein [Acidobacteria bacterium AH-259-D05]
MQTVSSIVTALAAVFALVTRSNPTLSWILVCIALLAIASAFYKPVVVNVRNRVDRIRRNRRAIKYWPDVLRFEQRFNDFVGHTRNDTLRNVLNNLCQNNRTELAKLYPPEFLRESFALLAERHRLYPVRKKTDFCLAVRELQQQVGFYNDECVNRPLERLRSPEWEAKISDHYQREIENSREQWVLFVNDFELFLKQLNAEFGNRFMCYFERARKLFPGRLPAPLAT